MVSFLPSDFASTGHSAGGIFRYIQIVSFLPKKGRSRLFLTSLFGLTFASGSPAIVVVLNVLFQDIVYQVVEGTDSPMELDVYEAFLEFF